MLISPEAEKLFTEALTLSAEERQGFLQDACGSNHALLKEISSLLTAANSSEAYFEQLSDRVGLSTLADSVDQTPIDTTIGQWRLVQMLGRGGMGTVYLAQRADGQFEKQVALKILPIGFDNELARSRFLNERQILAQLVHDKIARLLDGGVTADGTPYFVMDYVQGVRIDDYCEQHSLSVKSIIQLILDVASGVQYAHRNLIIHRDLKPTNILVEPTGHVKLLDFGIAKVLEPAAVNTELTVNAQRPATPAYASPEMLRGEAVDITTDVYSLGVILYQLLTKQLPINFDDMSLVQMHAHILTATPVPASRLNGAIDTDLDAIIFKAIAKDPGERYESIQSFVQDIQRHLDGLPVVAKAPSAWYRTKKFIGRHRTGVGLATLATLVLTAFALFAGYSAIQSERQRQAIALERDRANATREFLVGLFEGAGPNKENKQLNATEIMQQARERLSNELQDQPALRADLLETIGEVYAIMGSLAQARSAVIDEVELRAEANGEDSLEYFGAVIRLSQAEDQIGNFAAAEEQALRAVELSKSIDDVRKKAWAHNRLGRAKHLLGDLASAEIEYQRAIDMLRQELGDAHEETAGVKLSYAALLGHLDRHEEAYAVLVDIEDAYRKMEIEFNHIATDHHLTMARTLMHLGRFDESLARYQHTLEANNKVYGPDNSFNLYIVNGMSQVAEEQGDYEQAMALTDETYRLLLMHTPDSPNVGRALINRGRIYQLSGRCDKAVPEFEQALLVFAERLPDHWVVGTAKRRLGECLTEQKEFYHAEPLVLESVRIASAQLAPDHTEVVSAKTAAVSLYEQWGKPEKAEGFR